MRVFDSGDTQPFVDRLEAQPGTEATAEVGKITRLVETMRTEGVIDSTARRFVDDRAELLDRIKTVTEHTSDITEGQRVVLDRLPPSRTATQLARAAIANLGEAAPEVIRSAMNVLAARKGEITPAGLLTILERRTRVGEVLNQVARTWSDATLNDFVDAIRIPRGDTAAMDAIVSLAVLNNSELRQEVLAENLPEPSAAELQDNRVIVAQSPPAGSVMTPPYVILVAVEYRSTAAAEEVVSSIVDQLVEEDGWKMPRAAAEKVRG